MGKRHAKPIDDDDDDDLPPRVGRPRAPEVFGPPKPMPHQRKEYWNRLQAILDALEVGEVDRDVRMYLQRIIQRCDLLRRLDARRFTTEGTPRIK
jgi:hypothetical protein